MFRNTALSQWEKSVRKRIKISLLINLFFLQALCYATSVAPSEKRCPICTKSFISTIVQSYSNFGTPARDFSDSYSVGFGGIKSCPYCLYSSFRNDFDELSKDEITAIKTFLVKPKLDLFLSEKVAINSSPKDSWLRQTYYLEQLLARECYKLRKDSYNKNIRLDLQLYYTSKEEGINIFYRKRLVKSLSQLLTKNDFSIEDQAVQEKYYGLLTTNLQH